MVKLVYTHYFTLQFIMSTINSMELSPLPEFETKTIHYGNVIQHAIQVSENGLILTPGSDWRSGGPDCGYMKISLQFNKDGNIVYNDNGKVKSNNEYVSRLVAMAFLGDPPIGKGNVYHIDKNKMNNHYTNLKWMSTSEISKESANPKGKSVKMYMYDKDQNTYTFVDEYKSINEGARIHNVSEAAVRKSCSKKVEELGKARKFAKSEFFKTHAFRKDGEEL